MIITGQGFVFVFNHGAFNSFRTARDDFERPIYDEIFPLRIDAVLLVLREFLVETYRFP